MLKFSLLVPTRERIIPLKRFFQSLLENTNNPSYIEVLIMCDNDDIQTIEALKLIQEEYKILNITYYQRTRSEWNNEDYYNCLARKSKGKFIWVCADDLIFLVKGWDDIIWDKLNFYLGDKPDRLVCANILDNTPAPGEPPGDKSEFPCFPLFSKEVLQVLGEVLNHNLPTWGADRYAYTLFTKIKRFLVINDKVYINHVSYHTKVMEADALTTRAGEICAKYAVIDKHKPHKQGNFIEQQANQLKVYITNKLMDCA
jgi:hypothetical protein